MHLCTEFATVLRSPHHDITHRLRIHFCLTFSLRTVDENLILKPTIQQDETAAVATDVAATAVCLATLQTN
jgi:hypothetical protein